MDQSPAVAKLERERHSHQESSRIAATVSASRAARPSWVPWTNKLKEMPRFRRSVRSINGAKCVDSCTDWPRRERTAAFAAWSATKIAKAMEPPRARGVTANDQALLVRAGPPRRVA